MTNSAQTYRLVTFNLEAAMIALYKSTDAMLQPGASAQRALYSDARKLAADAGIYILDLHGAKGTIGERIVALKTRIRMVVEQAART